MIRLSASTGSPPTSTSTAPACRRRRGYASSTYACRSCRKLCWVDVLVGGEPVDALSLIIHRDSAYDRGRLLVEKLREEIPRQMFDVAIQAAIGSRVIARETVKARRKDVLANATAATSAASGSCWRSRRREEADEAGGAVEVPQEAFLAVLNLNEPAAKR